MKGNTLRKNLKRLTALFGAATLVLCLSNGALAEMATKEIGAVLTDEERAAARATYDAAVDAALEEILAAGGLTREAVDSYHALRDAERLLEKMDTSTWTQDQITAYRQAVSENSMDEAALAGLVSQGMLTEAEIAAIKLKYGDHVTIMDLINQVDTSKATTEMVGAITEAREEYMQAMTNGSAGMRPGNDHGDMNRTRPDKSTRAPSGGAESNTGTDSSNGTEEGGDTV